MWLRPSDKWHALLSSHNVCRNGISKLCSNALTEIRKVTCGDWSKPGILNASWNGRMRASNKTTNITWGKQKPSKSGTGREAMQLFWGEVSKSKWNITKYKSIRRWMRQIKWTKIEWTQCPSCLTRHTNDRKRMENRDFPIISLPSVN